MKGEEVWDTATDGSHSLLIISLCPLPFALCTVLEDQTY